MQHLHARSVHTLYVRTLSESGAPSSAGAERGPLERGHSFPVAATVKSQYTTSLACENLC